MLAVHLIHDFGLIQHLHTYALSESSWNALLVKLFKIETS